MLTNKEFQIITQNTKVSLLLRNDAALFCNWLPTISKDRNNFILKILDFASLGSWILRHNYFSESRQWTTHRGVFTFQKN